eukprot:symbB.v1.2.007782.t3/scaffold483.1/size198091/5
MSSVRVEVPRPVQLGSLKSENEGQDPGIRLVPAGGGGWGRKKEDVIEEEEVVETQQQNPRLGNLTSQPAQLRPTAWGRSSLSAQAGPRPAPWAQPPPGKVVPEPVPLERRQQEDFPSLGAEPVKGRKSSGSTPSTRVQVPLPAVPATHRLRPVWFGGGQQNQPSDTRELSNTRAWVSPAISGAVLALQSLRSRGGLLQRPAEAASRRIRARRYTSVDWLANLKGLSSSNLLRRILGPVLCTTSVAVVVYILSTFLPQGKFLHASTTGHALLVSALGLLLVFRTNTAYSRFWEGRQIWQQILDLGRNMARAAILWRAEMGSQTSAHICRLVQAFPYCMIEHLRGKKDKSMRSKLERLIGPKGELACYCQPDYSLPLSSNRPLFIVNQLAYAIREVPNGKGDKALYTNRERSWLMQNLEKLSATIGACERLVQTPVPLSYVRHTSRFLSLFMLTLPFALVDVLGPYTIPVTCFASWALFGIFEIGLVIEDPFQGVLKVEVIADTLQVDIEECIKSLGALDLLEAGALGKEVNRGDASSWEPSRELPSTGEELSVARAASLREKDQLQDAFEAPERPKEPTRLRSAELKEQKSRQPQLLVQIFESYDVNGDKAIDKKEMQKVLRETTTSITLPEDCIDAIFNEADSDGDGLLTQAEWCAWAEQCLDRAEIADLVLRMPSSPPLPADSLDDTDYEEAKDEEEEMATEREKWWTRRLRTPRRRPKALWKVRPSLEGDLQHRSLHSLSLISVEVDASSRPIGAAPTRSSYLQDRPVAAERREALERREREEALRAAAVLAPPKREEPVPVVKEFREEPRREERKAMERQNSDPDEADKDKDAGRPPGSHQPSGLTGKATFQPEFRALGKLIFFATHKKHIRKTRQDEFLTHQEFIAAVAAAHETHAVFGAGLQYDGCEDGSKLLAGAPLCDPATGVPASCSACPSFSAFQWRSPGASAACFRRWSISNKIRIRFKMSKHRYLKNVKRVRYISAIPQYTGPLGRQTKKRWIIKDYRKTPRLRELMKNLADKRRAEKKEEEEERARQQFDRAQDDGFHRRCGEFSVTVAQHPLIVVSQHRCAMSPSRWRRTLPAWLALAVFSVSSPHAWLAGRPCDPRCRPSAGRGSHRIVAKASDDALQEKLQQEAFLLDDGTDVKLPAETALAMRARARRRANWARQRLDDDTPPTQTEVQVLEIPTERQETPREDVRSKDIQREGHRIRQRVQAKRAKEREEAEKRAATEEWRREQKQRRRAERMASSHGVELPTLEEAHRMTLVQLRDALWNAGYPARGLPSPAEARRMDPEDLKIELKESKVRFLTQLRHILRKAPKKPQNEAEEEWS